MKAVILAGGRGTRLAPYTSVLPKPLLPLGQRPILEIIVSQLRDRGFTDITVAVGYLGHLIEAYFGDGRRFGVHMRYSYEDAPLGTAGPLTLISGLDQPFLAMNGDLLTDLDYSDLYRYHLEQQAAITVALYTKEVKIDLGVLEVNQRHEVEKYTEKPTYTYTVSMGIYVIDPAALRYIPRGQRFDFPDLVQKLLEEDQKISGYKFGGQWLDIGRPEDYARAAESFLKQAELPVTAPASVPALELQTAGSVDGH
jgi:NDP-sugar pyrophosphorylase family protein